MLKTLLNSFWYGSDKPRKQSLLHRRALALEPLEDRTLLSATTVDDTALASTMTSLAATSRATGATWTVMVYMDGDNNLESAAINDFLELSSVGSSSNVHIVVELDRIGGYDSTYGNWTDARRGLISAGDTPTASWGTSMGEVDMGDPNTLSSFVNWAITNYAADNYAVVLWDHGGGWEGACEDDSSWNSAVGNYDYLQLSEVKSALAAVPENIDLFGYDCCMMSMLECAYETVGEATVYVGSEESIPNDGWSYDTVLADLVASPSWTATQLASDIVTRYQESYSGTSDANYTTLSALDLSVVDSLATKVSDLATVMMSDATTADYARLKIARTSAGYYTDSNFRDLGTFLNMVAADTALSSTIRTAAQAAVDVYDNAVLANYSAALEGGTGLSIYFSAPGSAPDSTYNSTTLSFAADTQWNEFLTWWKTGPSAVTTPTVTDVNISISGATGTGGAYHVGDTVTAQWNNTATGDNNSNITAVTVNFSPFGGGAAVAATNSSGTWTASYTLIAGAIDATNRNVSVTATNSQGGSKTTADTTNATVDNQPAVVSNSYITVASVGSGTGSAYAIGDTLTVQWNDSATGDNNTDTLAAVTMDFSKFGGGAAVAATNTGDLWQASCTMAALNEADQAVVVRVTDNAGNSTTTTHATTLTLLVPTIVVTTADDIVSATDNVTSLREAIAEVNANAAANVIAFAVSLAGKTITLTQGELVITHSMTITGLGATQLTIDAHELSRIFDVDDANANSNINVTIEGLTLTGGHDVAAGVKGGNGGALYSAENLTVRNCTIANNDANGGGGIYAVTTTNGVTVIENNIFYGNMSLTGGGILVEISGSGAATIQNNTIFTNSANSGGGIAAEVDGSGAVTLRNNTLYGNNALGGGGIHVNTDTGSVLILGCMIYANTASDGAGIEVAHRFGTAVVTIQDTTIYANVATFAGGGIESSFVSDGALVIQNCTIAENVGADGGGLFSSATVSGAVTLQSTMLAGNIATSDTTPDIAVTGTLTLDHCLIGDNTGSGLTEAPVGSPDANGNLIGGATHGAIDPKLAVLADNGGTTLTLALLAGSAAIDAGSNPASLATDQRGAGYARTLGPQTDIGAYESAYGKFTTTTTVDKAVDPLVVTTADDVVDAADGLTSLREALAYANSHTGADTIKFDAFLLTGKTIKLTQGSLSLTDATGTTIIVGLAAEQLTISGNNATSVFTIGSSASVNISGLTITEGNAANGGGINNTGTLTITNCVFTASSAAQGGAIYNSSTATITACTFSGNSAESYGAAVRSVDKTVINNSTFSGNTSGIWGGALSTYGGTLTVSRSTFVNNNAGTWGGAIDNDGDCALTVINSTFTKNIAAWGGGIENWSGVATIANCTIVNNTADEGGGISNDSGTVTVINTIIANNAGNTTSPDIGGAVTAKYCLIKSTTGTNFSSISGNNIENVDPNLGELADNGGPTQTMALLSGSVAINVGSNALIPVGVTTDQCGNNRIVNGTVDLGAYEVPAEEVPAEVNSLVVTTADDVVDAADGLTSLREALAYANGLAGNDTITFSANLTGKTITLTQGELRITDSVTIGGLGSTALTIDANQLSRIFDVDDGNANNSIDVVLEGLRLTGGKAASNATGWDGGAIYSYENLTVRDCTIAGNQANTGGGIYAETANATILIEDSVIYGNHSLSGGGIRIVLFGTGTTTIQNNTIFANSAHGGGGIEASVDGSATATIQNNSLYANDALGGGGIHVDINDGHVFIIGCTVYANSANDGAGIAIDNTFGAGVVTIQNTTLYANRAVFDGGGILSSFSYGGALVIQNCTLADNVAANNVGLVSTATGSETVTIQSTLIAGNAATSGTTSDLGVTGVLHLDHCLIGDNAGAGLLEAPVGSPDAEGNLIGGSTYGAINPRLGLLADNGGMTLTVALMDDSPAVDAGANPANLTTDQRGTAFHRMGGAHPDIGAYEIQTPLITTTVVTSNSPSTTYGQTVVFTATMFMDSPAIPATGSVQFVIDGANYGTSVVLVNGQGSTSLNTLSVGTHLIYVIYTSDNVAAFPSNTSAVLSHFVAKATLTVTTGNQDLTYGNSLAQPTISNYSMITITGWVNGEGASVLDTLPTLSTSSINVGSYSNAIVAQGAADNNYQFQYQNIGYLNINPAELTVTAKSVEKTYGAAITVTGSVSNIQYHENIWFAYASAGAAATATVAGSPYDITATPGNASVSTLLGNYKIVWNLGTVTVEKANLTVTTFGQTKTYGDAIDVTGAGMLTGIKNHDNITAAYTSAGAAATAHVGSYVVQEHFSDPDGKLANYTIVSNHGFVQVNPAPLTVTADAKYMLAGGAVPALTVSYSPFVLGETPADLAILPKPTTAVTSDTPAGTYAISVTGPQLNGNYSVTYVAGNLYVMPTYDAVYVFPDPLDPTQQTLYVWGTNANDTIVVKPGATAGSVTVTMNGVVEPDYFPTDRIIVHGLAGDDYVGVSVVGAMSTWVYGDSGNDNLSGGGGPIYLFGGAGNDALWGGKGRSILVGDAGQDTLAASTGDAILIGGSISYDEVPSLQAILNEWSSAASYATRVAHLTGASSGGLNGAQLLDATTVNDDLTKDTLVGSTTGMDLFFLGRTDVISGNSSGETTISNVAVDAATGVLTWTAADTDGIVSTSLLVDGQKLSTRSTSGTTYQSGYAAQLGNLSAGEHTYTITTVDAKNTVVNYIDTFTLSQAITTAPTISGVVVATTAATPVITWRVVDSDGIAAAVLTIDGINKTVCGPYGTKYDANYAGLLGTLSAGAHTYVITATDVNGVANTCAGSFTVASANTTTAPTISGVVVATTASTPVITCNVADSDGIAAVVIKIDGVGTTVCGPYGTKYDANYAGLLGTLTSGNHTYTITATDAQGLSNTSTGTFTVASTSAKGAPTISGVVVAAAASAPVITWNVADSDGIASTTIKVDGVKLTIYGPYGTKYDANYAGALGKLASGSHTYTIKATDAKGVSNTSTGTFTVTSKAAVAAAVSSSVSASVKSDWLIDYTNAATNADDRTNATAAVFATY